MKRVSRFLSYTCLVITLSAAPSLKSRSIAKLPGDMILKMLRSESLAKILEGVSCGNTTVKKFVENFIYNTHKVKGYKLYRSMQLPKAKEAELLSRHNIGLAINLRGEHPEFSWWQNQKQATQNTETAFICAKTSENHFPPMQELLTMLAVIHNPSGVIKNPEDARQNPMSYVFAPDATTKDSHGREIRIKVNCKAGADRTGMFCALFVLERKLSPDMSFIEAFEVLKRARQELALSYWHIKPLHPTMDEFIEVWWKLRQGKTLEKALKLYVETIDNQEG